ncbi:hypothetical protein DFJ73DRAFT_160076 [Zopfochytrium polystomum]|nr:hypothetical protein DFJ73DRAFT_160076 [Zopfochytrium polystomum]
MDSTDDVFEADGIASRLSSSNCSSRSIHPAEDGAPHRREEHSVPYVRSRYPLHRSRRPSFLPAAHLPNMLIFSVLWAPIVIPIAILLGLLPSFLQSSRATYVSAVPGGAAVTYVDSALQNSALAPKQIIQSATPPVGPIVFSPQDLLLVTTVDGSLHGVHKPSGRTLWTVKDSWGPLVHVVENPTGTVPPIEQDQTGDIPAGGLPGDRMPKGFGPDGIRMEPRNMDEGLIIPEPAGDGNLYHLVPGAPIQVLLTLNSPRWTSNSRPFRDFPFR